MSKNVKRFSFESKCITRKAPKRNFCTREGKMKRCKQIWQNTRRVEKNRVLLEKFVYLLGRRKHKEEEKEDVSGNESEVGEEKEDGTEEV